MKRMWRVLGVLALGVLWAQNAVAQMSNDRTGVAPAPAFTVNVQVALNRVAVNAALRNAVSPTQVAELTARHPALVGLKAAKPLVNLPSQGGEHALERWHTLTFAGRDTAGVINRLIASGLFASSEPNRARTLHSVTPAPAPNDPEGGAQYYHPLIKTLNAWGVTRGASSIRIGFIDTGLEYRHLEFTGQVWINGAEDLNGNGVADSTDFDGLDNDGNGYIDDIHGYDFVDQPTLLGGGDDLTADADPTDDNGHGTGVASVIGARYDNNFGGYGVAPGCPLVPLRAFSGGGVGEDDDISRAIVYAGDNNVRVLNMSFGDIYPSQMMHAALQYAYARGVVLVNSAGNASGDSPHYPSAFPEVMCVSASAWNSDNGNEFLWLFSNYGTTVDLCAPGSALRVAGLLDEDSVPTFTDLSGTSFAAPQVAAAAGLLLSVRPELTPSQVRGILVSTADDIDDAGWDHYTGAGRLNLARALAFQGGAVVEILNPVNDDGSAHDTLRIAGTVLHPQCASWSLRWKPGTEDIGPWNFLRENIAAQVFADELFTWNVSALAEGQYTLSLVAHLTTGATVESRVVWVRDTSLPQIDLRINANVWDNDIRKHLITYRSTDVCVATLYFQAPGSTEWRTRVADKRTRNGEFLLVAEEMGQGTHRWVLECQNAAGLVARTDTFTFDFQPDAVPYIGVVEKPYEFPMGAYLPAPYDLNADGQANEVVFSRYDSLLNFGHVVFAEFVPGVGFIFPDSINEWPVLLPKDLRDWNNDGRLDFLANLRDSIFVHSQPGVGQFPTLQTQFLPSSGRFPSQWADVDADGQMEMLVRTATAWYVWEWNGNNWIESAELPDTNANINGSGPPVCAVGDLDADGRPEVWFGDYDGNLYAYEHVSGNDYQQVHYIGQLQQIAASNYLRIADFDGDGLTEILVASHSPNLRNNDFEYDPQYFTLQLIKGTGNNSFDVVWRDYFYNVFSTTYNALTAANLDGDAASEAIFSCYPRQYVLDQDGTGGLRMRWMGGGIATHHLVGDFDSNGRPEFTLGLGDRAIFLELDPNAAAQGIYLSGHLDTLQNVQLQWNTVPNATQYAVFRQMIAPGQNPSNLTQIATPTLPRYTDTSLAINGNQYVYAIVATVPGQGQMQSDYLFLTPHTPTRAISATPAGPGLIRLTFSGPVAERPRDLPLYTVDDSLRPQQMVAAGSHSLLLRFAAPLAAGPHIIRLDTNLLDAQLERLATPFALTFNVPEDTTARLYLTRWEKVDEQTALLHFNAPLAPATVLPAHFTVYPGGGVSQLALENNGNTLRVNLQGVRLGPTGQPVTITVGNAVRGTNNEQTTPGQGDAATFAENASSLSGVYVYPSPVRANEVTVGCFFGGLPRVCSINVLAQNGQVIRSLQENDGDGGLEWDLTDFSNRRLAPGVYLFVVATPDGERHLGRFVVAE